MSDWGNQQYYSEDVDDVVSIEQFIDRILVERAKIQWDVKHSRINVIQVGVGIGLDTLHLIRYNSDIEVIAFEHRDPPEGETTLRKFNEEASEEEQGRLTFIAEDFGQYDSKSNLVSEKLGEKIDLIIINAEALATQLDGYLQKALEHLYYQLAYWGVVVVYRAEMDQTAKALWNLGRQSFFSKLERSQVFPHSPHIQCATPRYPKSGMSTDVGKKESVDANA